MTERNILSIRIEFSQNSDGNYPINLIIKHECRYENDETVEIPAYYVADELQRLINKIANL